MGFISKWELAIKGFGSCSSCSRVTFYNCNTVIEVIAVLISIKRTPSPEKGVNLTQQTLVIGSTSDRNIIGIFIRVDVLESHITLLRIQSTRNFA